MKRIEGLSIHVVGAMALATIFGTSAFADNRHPDTTEHARSAQRSERRSGGSESRQGRQRDEGRHDSARQRQQSHSPESFSQRERLNSGAQRGFEQRDRAFEQRDRSGQSQSFRDRSNSRDSGHRDFGRDRGFHDGNRERGFHDGRDRGVHGGRDGGRITGEGRINRMMHERGGYRVWLDRGQYSYFVPEARFRLFPLRLGLSIRFGGFYDPLGYVNVYDIDPFDYAPAYGSPVYGAPAYSSGLLRGVVESVDYRRGTVVLNDDASGQFVTATMNGRDRRFEDLRPGDWVELSGDFGRGGFEAYRVENFRAGHY